MDIQEYNEVIKRVDAARLTLGQCRPEWQQFLEYTSGYFKNRGIEHPIVVEIGILSGAQKQFYEEILGAKHIGIDIDEKTHPDILGDSRSSATMENLKMHLKGQPIDLLFLDGNHYYDQVKFEYKNYGLMTRHLIAVHDLFCTDAYNVEVMQFWQELEEIEKNYVFLTFHKQRSHEITHVWPGHEMGIGIVIKT